MTTLALHTSVAVLSVLPARDVKSSQSSAHVRTVLPVLKAREHTHAFVNPGLQGGTVRETSMTVTLTHVRTVSTSFRIFVGFVGRCHGLFTQLEL